MNIEFREVPDENNREVYLLLRRLLETADVKTSSVSIGIAGDKGTGKTVFSRNILKFLGEDNAAVIGVDDYMMSRQERASKGITGFYPEAFDLRLAKENLSDLLQGRRIEKPIYDHSKGVRSSCAEAIEPKKIIIVNGSMALQPILAEFHYLSYFLEITPSSESGRPWNFQERVERDIRERSYSREQAEALWAEDRRGYERFVLPTKAHADLVYEVLPGYVLRFVEAKPRMRELI